MSGLSPSDFATFFREVHGHKPFMWQGHLLDKVVLDRRWPKVIDVPTGAGKTACIDVALFALALNLNDASPSWCARRIVMVVDRRVVVDQAARRAHKIALGRSGLGGAEALVAGRVVARHRFGDA